MKTKWSLFILAGALSMGSAMAVDTYVGANTGYWDDAGNWTSFTNVPPSGSDAKVVVANDETITLTNAYLINQLALGSGGNNQGDLIIDGGALTTDTTGWSAIGYNGSGSLTLTNGGSWTASGRIDLGTVTDSRSPVNILRMYDNTALTTSGDLNVGKGADANRKAHVYVHGGTLTADEILFGTPAGDQYVDFAGAGKAVLTRGDERDDIAANVAAGLMGASEDGKLVRATFDSGETTVQAVSDTADFVRFEDGDLNIAGGGDGDWSNGANWRNQTINRADGYAAGSNDTVRIKAGKTATLTGNVVIGGLLMGDNESDVGLIVDGGELRVIDPNKKGWSSFSYNRSSTTVVRNGGSIDFEHSENVYLGVSDAVDDSLVSLTIEDGSVTVEGYLGLGNGYNAMHTSSVHVVIGESGLLDVGSLGIDNDNNLAGKGSVWVNVLEGGTLMIDGDASGNVNTWIGDGRLRFNGEYGVNANAGVDYQMTVGGGRTTIVAIPEPATLGLVAMFGGVIVFMRRRFRI